MKIWWFGGCEWDGIWVRKGWLNRLNIDWSVAWKFNEFFMNFFMRFWRKISESSESDQADDEYFDKIGKFSLKIQILLEKVQQFLRNRNKKYHPDLL